ncbi:YlxR family protein [Mycoplasma sp. NEAQ87857]|uniref:YlxR family protein n=1 Tax=Mycoplasma sp. NEAQ87857 TaxID=2683967 RepID=UPI001E4D88E1|nr:YlxR family protein [Mycoplasma sp. NEAQ87857]
MNKTYTRKCIVTNQIVDISLLVRFNYNKKTQEVTLDLNKNLPNRGAYFIPNATNWAKLKKTKALNRVFRTNFTKETYETIEQQLMEVLNEQEK